MSRGKGGVAAVDSSQCVVRSGGLHPPRRIVRAVAPPWTREHRKASQDPFPHAG